MEDVFNRTVPRGAGDVSGELYIRDSERVFVDSDTGNVDFRFHGSRNVKVKDNDAYSIFSFENDDIVIYNNQIDFLLESLIDEKVELKANKVNGILCPDYIHSASDAPGTSEDGYKCKY